MLLTFEHIHLISADPLSTTQWYVDKLGAEIIGQSEVRGAPQNNLNVGGATLLIRGHRSGEVPKSPSPMQHYAGYSSHNEWGGRSLRFCFQRGSSPICRRVKRKRCKVFGWALWIYAKDGNQLYCCTRWCKYWDYSVSILTHEVMAIRRTIYPWFRTIKNWRPYFNYRWGWFHFSWFWPNVFQSVEEFSVKVFLL